MSAASELQGAERASGWVGEQLKREGGIRLLWCRHRVEMPLEMAVRYQRSIDDGCQTCRARALDLPESDL